MTKQEFLSRLEGLLQDLEPEDREDALAFYREYLEDAGEENEQSALADLGDVEELAKQIRAACPVRQQDNQQVSNPSPEPTRWPAPTQYVRPEDTFQQEVKPSKRSCKIYKKVILKHCNHCGDCFDCVGSSIPCCCRNFRCIVWSVGSVHYCLCGIRDLYHRRIICYWQYWGRWIGCIRRKYFCRQVFL